jgi:CheY-like chemotaxis protein
MSQETLERAFEPFFTTKPRDKGTGLGLAMVYGFVKQSGGTARIYSELGVGTNVSMYLPLVEASLEQPAVTPDEHPPAKLDCTVLMVDDEADLLKIAVAYLAEMGCTALKATDGASALEIVKRERKIDLMVTDIIMPSGMTGVDLAQRVSELNPDIKVIYSSGFPADVLAERRMSPRDGPLLRKPYQRAEFRAVIRRVLEGNNTKPD